MQKGSPPEQTVAYTVRQRTCQHMDVAMLSSLQALFGDDTVTAWPLREVQMDVLGQDAWTTTCAGRKACEEHLVYPQRRCSSFLAQHLSNAADFW
jgi:hypothetical protein